MSKIKYKDGEPCGHPGCLHHITHPCEGCGRIGGRDTRKNEKCPCCGHTGVIIHYPDDKGCGWFCGNENCSFSCNPEDLPRIAAAMDLARAYSAFKLEKDPEAANKLWPATRAAEQNAIEVFGGE